MASARGRVTTNRRRSFLICRVQKGTSNEYDERNAKLARKSDANCLPRSRAEDCRRRGLRNHVSERVAQHGFGIESRICVQCGRVVRWRALHENLPLNGNVCDALPNRRRESATRTNRFRAKKNFTKAARNIGYLEALRVPERRRLCFGRRYARRAMFPDRIRCCCGVRI